MSSKTEILNLLDQLKAAIESLGVTETCTPECETAAAPPTETTAVAETPAPPAA